MSDIRLRLGRRNTGIRPGYILSVSSDNRLFVWDEEGRPVHFIDYERSAEALPSLQLDPFFGADMRANASLLMLFTAIAGYNLEFVHFDDTNIHCRGDVRGDLYRVTDPLRPLVHTVTNSNTHRSSRFARPFSR